MSDPFKVLNVAQDMIKDANSKLDAAWTNKEYRDAQELKDYGLKLQDMAYTEIESWIM